MNFLEILNQAINFDKKSFNTRNETTAYEVSEKLGYKVLSYRYIKNGVELLLEDGTIVRVKFFKTKRVATLRH